MDEAVGMLYEGGMVISMLFEDGTGMVFEFVPKAEWSPRPPASGTWTDRPDAAGTWTPREPR